MSETQTQSAPDPSLNVFIVENHADTLKALTSYLQMTGHRVTSARSVAEALELLPRTACDVFLSDIGLPDGDGWELLERAQLPAQVVAVAMSGFGMNADRTKSKAAGYKHHLLKPFKPDDLDRILEEAARESGAGRADCG